MQQAMTDERLEEMIRKIQTGSMRMSETDALAIAGQLFSRGRYKQVENICNQLIKNKPSLPDAHSILGVALNAQGKKKEGVASIKRAIKLNPKVSSFSIARPTWVIGRWPTKTGCPLARACASVMPARPSGGYLHR